MLIYILILFLIILILYDIKQKTTYIETLDSNVTAANFETYFRNSLNQKISTLIGKLDTFIFKVKQKILAKAERNIISQDSVNEFNTKLQELYNNLDSIKENIRLKMYLVKINLLTDTSMTFQKFDEIESSIENQISMAEDAFIKFIVEYLK